MLFYQDLNEIYLGEPKLLFPLQYHYGLWGIGLQGMLYAISVMLEMHSCEQAWIWFAVGTLEIRREDEY